MSETTYFRDVTIGLPDGRGDVPVEVVIEDGASLPCGNCGGTPHADGRCCPECTHVSEYQRGWADGWKAARSGSTPADDVTGDVRQAVQS